MNLSIGAVQRSVQAGDLPLEKLAGNAHVTEADKAHEVARQFEAVLLRQILQSAHQTGIQGMFSEASASKDVYFDMLNYHLADTISRGEGLGLAGALEARLQRQMPAAGSPADPGADEDLP